MDLDCFQMILWTLYLFLLMLGIAYRFSKITSFCKMELKGGPDLSFNVASF